jgi:nucleoid-associated protein YgaU
MQGDPLGTSYRPEHPPRQRPGALLTLAVIAALACAWAAWNLALLVPAAAQAADRGPAGPLLAVTAAIGTVVLVRLCLTALACAVCGLVALVPVRRPTGGWGASRLCAHLAVAVSPRLVRPVLAAALTGTLALGTATAASAAPGSNASARGTAAATATAATTATASDVEPPPLPDPAWPSGALAPAAPGIASAPARPSGTLAPVAPGVLPAPTWTPGRPVPPRRKGPDVGLVAAAPSRHGESPPVVVHRGDTLWSIATRQLGPGATTADVAHEWPRWWRANRATIGPDPDLLRPGQVLVPPTPGPAR